MGFRGLIFGKSITAWYLYAVSPADCMLRYILWCSVSSNDVLQGLLRLLIWKEAHPAEKMRWAEINGSLHTLNHCMLMVKKGGFCMLLLWCKHFNKICIFICLIWTCLVKGWNYTSISKAGKSCMFEPFTVFLSVSACWLVFLCTQLQHVVSRCYSLLRMFRHISYTAIKRHGADIAIKHILVVFFTPTIEN